mmetsp:Transcript_8565/g.20811  ORF Transcript_8565/g.20811 Transcript_8565/m.20811 type:complete len:1062 (+) Transcript_8565:100-3285(+)
MPSFRGGDNPLGNAAHSPAGAALHRRDKNRSVVGEFGLDVELWSAAPTSKHPNPKASAHVERLHRPQKDVEREIEHRPAAESGTRAQTASSAGAGAPVGAPGFEKSAADAENAVVNLLATSRDVSDALVASCAQGEATGVERILAMTAARKRDRTEENKTRVSAGSKNSTFTVESEGGGNGRSKNLKASTGKSKSHLSTAAGGNRKQQLQMTGTSNTNKIRNYQQDLQQHSNSFSAATTAFPQHQQHQQPSAANDATTGRRSNNSPTPRRGSTVSNVSQTGSSSKNSEAGFSTTSGNLTIEMSKWLEGMAKDKKRTELMRLPSFHHAQGIFRRKVQPQLRLTKLAPDAFDAKEEQTPMKSKQEDVVVTPAMKWEKKKERLEKAKKFVEEQEEKNAEKAYHLEMGAHSPMSDFDCASPFSHTSVWGTFGPPGASGAGPRGGGTRGSSRGETNSKSNTHTNAASCLPNLVSPSKHHGGGDRDAGDGFLSPFSKASKLFVGSPSSTCSPAFSPLSPGSPGRAGALRNASSPNRRLDFDSPGGCPSPASPGGSTLGRRPCFGGSKTRGGKEMPPECWRVRCGARWLRAVQSVFVVLKWRRQWETLKAVRVTFSGIRDRPLLVLPPRLLADAGFSFSRSGPVDATDPPDAVVAPVEQEGSGPTEHFDNAATSTQKHDAEGDLDTQDEARGRSSTAAEKSPSEKDSLEADGASAGENDTNYTRTPTSAARTSSAEEGRVHLPTERLLQPDPALLRVHREQLGFLNAASARKLVCKIRRMKAKVVFRSLTHWTSSGKAMMAFRRYYARVCLIQRWWREACRVLHKTLDRLSRRWAALEEQQLRKKLEKFDRELALAASLSASSTSCDPPRGVDRSSSSALVCSMVPPFKRELPVAERVSVAMIAEHDRLAFLKTALARKRKHEYLPKLQAWEAADAEYRARLERWRDDRRALKFLGANVELTLNKGGIGGSDQAAYPLPDCGFRPVLHVPDAQIYDWIAELGSMGAVSSSTSSRLVATSPYTKVVKGRTAAHHAERREQTNQEAQTSKPRNEPQNLDQVFAEVKKFKF